MFIAEKRNGNIEARKVAAGSTQRSYNGYDKLDGSSLTVAIDSIFVTGVMDAKEGKEVAILDIANVFFSAGNYKKNTDTSKR